MAFLAHVSPAVLLLLHRLIRDLLRYDRTVPVQGIKYSSVPNDDSSHMARNRYNYPYFRTKRPPRDHKPIDQQLFDAAERGSLQDVERALHNGGDPNDYFGEEECSAIHRACAQGFVEIVRALLRANKANLNARDNDGNTPLHFACAGRHFDVIRALLDEGASLEEKNWCARTVLHEASKAGNLEMVEWLLDEGADMHARCNPDGNRPLHLAVVGRHFEVVRALVEAPGGRRKEQEDIL